MAAWKVTQKLFLEYGIDRAINILKTSYANDQTWEVFLSFQPILEYGFSTFLGI